MAIGLARLFGFTFPENFDYPYIAQSMTEFWRRWHMSLSRWFRDLGAAVHQATGEPGAVSQEEPSFDWDFDGLKRREVFLRRISFFIPFQPPLLLLSSLLALSSLLLLVLSSSLLFPPLLSLSTSFEF
jgi:hypothetical protein